MNTGGTSRVSRMDVAESLANAGIGMVVGWAATYALLPIWGLAPSAEDAIGITAMFFALSFSRAWVLRVVFRSLA